MYTGRKSRYRDKYLKPEQPIKDHEAFLRKIVFIERVPYTIVIIGAMWLPDIQMLEMHPERCVIIRVNKITGELIDNEPPLNLLLTVE